jgi:signal transduction histidine kinase
MSGRRLVLPIIEHPPLPADMQSFLDAEDLLARLDRRDPANDRRTGTAADQLGMRELCHDLEQSLRSVRTLISLVAGGGPVNPADETTAVHLETLRLEVERLSATVRHHVSPLPAETVDLRMTARSVLACSAMVFPGRLELHAPRPVLVYGQRVLLHRALANLVQNACEATSTGRVIVTVEARDDEGVVDVEDHGDAGGRGGGAGLGLWIVHAAVGAHGGTVERGRSDLGGLHMRMRLPRGPRPSGPEATT